MKRIVEYGDGWIPRPGRDGWEPKSAVERLSKAAKAAGRDPKSMQIVVFRAPADAEALKPYRDTKIDSVLFDLPDVSRDEILSTLDKYAKLI